MKITQKQLKQMIKEEVQSVLKESVFNDPQIQKRLKIIKGILQKNPNITLYKISLEDMEDGTHQRAFDSWSGGLMGAARRNKDKKLVDLLQKLRYDIFGGDNLEMKQ